jgi:hypothetical protein
VHISALPADSAIVRRQLKAPLGWDNTTEMVAAAVDSINYLARLVHNANYENLDKSKLARVQRPYEDAPTRVEPETISFAAFGSMVKGENA